MLPLQDLVKGKFKGEMERNLQATVVLTRFNDWLTKNWPAGVGQVRAIFVRQGVLMIESKHPAYGAELKKREAEITAVLKPAVERLAFRAWIER